MFIQKIYTQTGFTHNTLYVQNTQEVSYLSTFDNKYYLKNYSKREFYI